MREFTCCFFGHRDIKESAELRSRLYDVIENLIVKEKADTFLLGSKSEFNSLCHETLNALKEKYPHIKRVFVRAEYPYIGDDYKEYLLESYDDTYFPEKILGAGSRSYVERNYEMIDKSRFCVVYFDEEYTPKKIRRSGTKIALDYAVKRKREIINVFC